MTIKVKINSDKLKFQMLNEGYGSAEELAKKADMSTSTITKALREGECTYATAFKIMDALGVTADAFVYTGDVA